MKKALLLLLWPSLAWAAPAGDRYNDPSPRAPAPPLVEKIDQLAARLAQKLHRAPPVRDARLDAAASEIARIVPERAPPPNELVQGALWMHGIVEPPPLMQLTTMGLNGEAELLERLKNDMPAVLAGGRYARIGVGLVPVGGGETRVLVAWQESFVTLAPIERAQPADARIDIRGRLREDFVHPEAFVTAPDGRVLTRMQLGGRAPAFAGSFRCGPERGRFQVEITAEDRFGETVLANFPLWCGQPAPRTLQEIAPPGGHDEETTTPVAAEKLGLKLLNADRARAHLPPLVWDEALANVARGHSSDMVAHDFFGHISPTTGSAQDRVRKASIDTQLLLENVARAFTAGEAERGLMSSPGHRANILNAEATHVGIGVTMEPQSRELLVTQLFSLPPEQLTEHSADDVRRQVDELRRARHLSPVTHEPAIDQLAQSLAEKLAHGQLTSHDVSGHVADVLGRQAGRWSELKSLVAVVGSPSQIVSTAKDSLADRAVSHVGLGIARGPRREGGQGLYVVLVLATAR